MVLFRGWLARLVAGCLLVTVEFFPVSPRGQFALAFQPLLGERTVPSDAYDLAQTTLATGDFRGALQIAGREYQGAIQVGGQRWIDSIAAAAIVGECHYELGDLRAAVAAYEDAMLLATTHSDWLLSVQFPQQRLRPSGQARVATWGRSGRGATPAAIPETVSIFQGGADPEQVLKKGGVLAGPVNFPIRPQQIMRAIVISIYRHGCIMGPLAAESAPLTGMQRALAKRPAPANHYSQSWIDVALGMALWSQGRADDAFARFKNGLLAENQFDHLLTSWALIGMGRIALDAGRDAEAAQFFEEATYTAADHGDARAIEEAFHWAFTAHMAAGSRGVPASIAGGADWCRRGLPVIHARLMAMQAECLATAGDPQAAGRLLTGIDGRLTRGDPGRGLCGADLAAAAASVAYRTGAIDLGDQEIGRAITIMQSREPRLFQLDRLVAAVRGGASVLSDRRASELFAGLLGDPPPRRFVIDPVGTLASITASRQEAFEAWIALADRRSQEDGTAAAEAAARGRWLESQPFGGRRNAIETLIASSADSLPADAAVRRAAILARAPQLAAAVDVMTRRAPALRNNLLAEEPANAQDLESWQEYRRAATTRAGMVAALAAGREPTAFDFPPLLPPAEIQRRLQAGEVMLSFRWTSSSLVGAIDSKNGRAHWEIKQTATLTKEMMALARALCLFESATAVPTERLVTSDWKLHAERIERILFKDSRINLGDPAVKELVIVPDGLLWYLPFEILPVGSGRDAPTDAEPSPMLRDTCRIRYCPTRSLGVDRFAATVDAGLVGVHVGRMHRGDNPEASRQLTERLTTSLGQPVFLGTPSGPPALVAASLVDTLVIFDELASDSGVAGRPLVPGTQRQTGITFGDWVASPRKQPRRVVTPGFVSAMHSGLTKLPSRPGDDLFLSVTDLLAAGARTAVVSRWRMGGTSTVHLVEEFVRDQWQHAAGAGIMPSAAESWHRAVDIVSAEEPDVTRGTG
ncbi:MAG: tetratricopeptide repeat protein [Planctomycetia bacterium]